MNWKLLSLAAIAISLTACEGKKEEKKSEEAKPAAAMPAPEADKPAAAMPAAPEAEHKTEGMTPATPADKK